MILNRKDIIKQYPWLKQKNHPFIISADYNGLICASFLSHILNWKLVGYYDLESLWVSEKDVINYENMHIRGIFQFVQVKKSLKLFQKNGKKSKSFKVSKLQKVF